MRRCWAQELGGCAGGMTGEHIISKSQFKSSAVTVQGFDWCKEPKTVGLGSLVANRLCRSHNTALSPTDREALKLFEAISERAQRRSDMQRGIVLAPKYAKVNGALLERWFLKTTINVALQGDASDPGIFLNGVPRQELVLGAFGHKSFARPLGLHGVATVGETIGEPGGILFQALNRRDDEALVGTMFVFHGHRFWLALEGAPAIQGALQPINAFLDPEIGFAIRFVWN